MKDLNDYVDTMICFCRYLLISKHQKHQNKDIYEFLKENKTKELKLIALDLKEGTIAYEAWQIFIPLSDAQLELIRKITLEHIQGEMLCHTY